MESDNRRKLQLAKELFVKNSPLQVRTVFGGVVFVSGWPVCWLLPSGDKRMQPEHNCVTQESTGRLC